MGAVAQFDLTSFLARYPEFTSTVTTVNGPLYFAEAGLYWRNDGTGPATDPLVQQSLMYKLTAHIASLSQVDASGAGLANPLVGRMNSASEGSVSVGTEFNVSVAGQGFAQTRYGSNFWQATNAYRRFRYRPGCSPWGAGGGLVPFFRG